MSEVALTPLLSPAMSSDSTAQLSPIERLASQVLENIGLYAGINCYLGPPTDLLALLSTSRTLYRVLSYQSNQHLWATVSSLKFDIDPVDRRLGERWTTSGCVAAEGRKRFAALKRIRHCIVAHPEGHLADLWTAYLMMLESDGRNESQLIEWANIPAYLYQVIAYRAAVRHESSSLWFSESEGTALAIWLIWMTSSKESIQREHPQLRAEMRALLHPFLVTGYRHPSAHTPDSHYKLPLCPTSQDTVAAHNSGPPPKTRSMLHWNHKLTIAAPTLTSAAFLCTVVRIEALQDATPQALSAQRAHLPANRAAADAFGVTGKTFEDVEAFHYRVRTKFLERCSSWQWGVDTSVSHVDPHAISSSRHDVMWHRLVSCYDPWDPQSSMRGVVYKQGMLSGPWHGRILLPEITQHLSMLMNPTIVPSSVGLSQDRISLEIQEHHCLSPDEPLNPGRDTTGRGDNVLNAFLPEGTLVTHVQDGIVVFNPLTGRQTRYETFVPGRPAPYSAAAMAKLPCSWIGGEDQSDDDEDEDMDAEPYGGALRADQVIPIDDDVVWEDTVQHLSSGVNDIFITGKTSQEQGDAWGHFRITGRVRSWDGLCVFLRVPTGPLAAHFGTWVFKGYIHNETFVGRWRETSTNVESIGWEGGFAMCKEGAR